MSTRVRKLLAPVFLIAIPLAAAVAEPIPAPTQRSINPGVGASGSSHRRPAALRNPIAPILRHSTTPVSSTAFVLSPAAHTRVYQENQAAEADLNASYDVFYDQLSSDGHWIFVENYGYVFQPNLAEKNADWRPYTNGHWESTDRGWYWDTDESFGWATYHYGRWANIDGTGWVWTPGTDWSPAWVSWRVCDTGFIGWAPLPPECPRPTEAVAIGDWCDSYSNTGPGAFCFLPFNAWFNPSYAGSFAPVTQNLELLNTSRNVTNISASKNLISSFGPRVEFIAQQTGRQVKTYTLHYSEVRGRNNFSRSINGNLLNVNGPVAKLKANATKVPTVIKTIVRPTVNKGWNGFTKDEIDGVHRRYASEAHIPSHLPTKPIERVNLVPSGTPTPTQLVRNQKEKETKPGKETVKGAAEKGSKGKAAGADHKTTGKHKTASKEESSSKEEGKSKSSKGAGGSKRGIASKSKSGSEESKSKDDNEPKTAKRSSTSKSGSSKSGASKKDNSSDDSGGSKSRGGSKGSGSKGGSSSKGKGSKSSSKNSSVEKKDE
jgi:hypothetical protein